VLLLLLLAAATPASAGVPDPRYSEADTCIVVSPAGAFTYTVRLRDESLAPVGDVDVVLDFTAAPGIVLCTASDPNNDRRVVARTDALGYVIFRVRGGGQSNGLVEVQALATLVRGAFARSTDLDGDLTVEAEDVTAHQALASNARAGDYDCDGDADAADRQFVQNQLGHNCLTVPVLRRSWGSLKSFYRD
jgi:hypothetical protein